MSGPDAAWPRVRADLEAMFAAAVAAADPSVCLAPHLPAPPRGRLIVIGAGKGAAAMAQAVEARYGDRVDGTVVTRHGHALPLRRITVVEAGHPVPDAAGVAGTEALMRRLDGLSRDDLILCLLSGGGSALLTAPPPGVPLADLQALTRALLRSGAAIGEINTVRRHLSLALGGRLAVRAAPARLLTLAVSDVPGDDRATLASGPTVADPTTRHDARAVLDRHGIAPPASIAAWLDDPASETPKPGEVGGDYVMAATPGTALAAATSVAVDAGYEVQGLGDAVEGEAREVAGAHARLAIAVSAAPGARPRLLLSGGETSVTVTGGGRGGRNAEYALALALALDGRPGVHALAADTDGVDGSEDNAGAVVTPDTLARGRALALDPAAHLADNDAYGWFAALGDLFVTGPTRTNVNDFRAIAITPSP